MFLQTIVVDLVGKYNISKRERVIFIAGYDLIKQEELIDSIFGGTRTDSV